MIDVTAVEEQDLPGLIVTFNSGMLPDCQLLISGNLAAVEPRMRLADIIPAINVTRIPAHITLARAHLSARKKQNATLS